MDRIIHPVPTRSKRGPYRRHSEEFKRAAVARTLVAGASVSRIARELEINSNQLFNWRKRFRVEQMAIGNASRQFLPVSVVDTPMASAPLERQAPGAIVLTIGQAQLRLEGQVDAATLTLLLTRLLP
jgi:transposase